MALPARAARVTNVGPVLAGLFLLLCVGLGLAAVAQRAATKPAAVSGLSDAEAKQQHLDCPSPYPPVAPLNGEIPHGAVTVLPETRWQPYLGDVHFRLTGMEKPPRDVRVFFAWQDGKQGPGAFCFRSPRVKLLPGGAGDDATVFTYTAQVPSLYSRPFYEALNGIEHRSWKSTVPLANLYVHFGLEGQPNSFVLTDTLGISAVGPAIGVALLAAGAAWLVLDAWARRRGVPGGFGLRIISTPNGVASLSQFQICLWTFVIGTGVVYVMMITGNLIDIPVATLGLLGISGFALVGSKLHAGNDDAPERMAPPGPVTELNVAGPAGPDRVVLHWNPPAARTPFTCTVRARRRGEAAWRVVERGVAAPPYTVTDLDPGERFDFEVFAVNAGGQGASCVLVDVPLAEDGNERRGVASPCVEGLVARPVARGVHLRWAACREPVAGYAVHYREAGSGAWVTADIVAETSAELVGVLKSNTEYHFHVRALAPDNTPGPPSAVALARTPVRRPLWSDLVVVESEDGREVDLARLQMLVFTSIAALFTGLTLLNTGQIPDIPVGELTLVGVSNGVYLGSKVAGR